MTNVLKAAAILLLFSLDCPAETGYAAWLRYARIDNFNIVRRYDSLPATVVALNPSPVIHTAEEEFIRGVQGMLGRTLRISASLPKESCILLATYSDLHRAGIQVAVPEHPLDDGYVLGAISLHGQRVLLVSAANDRGVLYGVFELLRTIALHGDVDHIHDAQSPYAPVRWTNEWDNLDGSIERGYGGRSIFFEDGKVIADLTRAGDYARLLASVGINGCTVNNVNADPRVLSSEFIQQIARIADAFRPWGVQLSIAVDFGSPQKIGHLDTFDPLDPRVNDWWKRKVDEIYGLIPDLGGILLKADSEDRLGPSVYGRTHADAANVIARVLRPHGGVLVYRGFVYNHRMDWRDLKNDRAKAAYDNFTKLDGKFDDNVLVQIKYGPIDFQVREPISPLFGALRHTNETIELQVAQEYTGQQRHLCFLLPMWKEMLDLDMRVDDRRTPVKEIVSGKTFRRPTGGLVAVTNVGRDQNWLGYDMAMANLYAFGRIAWNPDLSSQTIIDEWTHLTFGFDDLVVKTITGLQLSSWHVYESYTGFLGVGGLTDIIRGPNGAVGNHYGEGIESSEQNGWGQWHRADKNGIGMDRTAATGTGYIEQYPPELAARYESLAKCPDELLLFMHHVSYQHVLHSGKTVIQHIYDSHYAGAAAAQTFSEQWQRLRGRVDEDRYQAVLKKLEYQAGHAIVWRDAVSNWFLRTSAIPDAAGRVGHYPGRIEAESMTLDGYSIEPVIPWEGASLDKAIVCRTAKCSASTKFHGAAGWYDVSLQYFDQAEGISHFDFFVGNQEIGSWAADDTIPTTKPDAHSSTRHTLSGVALRPGDELKVIGVPDAQELAPIDYIEIKPHIRAK